MSETATIILPLPPRNLSPNCPAGSIGGRIAKAVASRKYRERAKIEATALQIDGTWEKATVSAVFYHKNARRRDDVNSLAMLKPAYDGVVDSGLIRDDDSLHLTTLGAKYSVDVKNPRVELTFTRLA